MFGAQVYIYVCAEIVLSVIVSIGRKNEKMKAKSQ